MMTTEIVLDSLGRVHELVPAVLKGLDRDDLRWRPEAGSNPIGWLIWHLTRAEDDHLADLGGRPQVWQTGWRERFGLPYADDAVGFGMTAEEVGAFDVPDVSLLVDYSAAVAEQTRQVLSTFTEADYEKIVDTRWDPPVTGAVRLVSVMVETAQHIGQAAYLRGLRERTIGRDTGWGGYV